MIESMTWDQAPQAMQSVATPIIATLVIVLVVYAAVAWVRVISGRSLDANREED